MFEKVLHYDFLQHSKSVKVQFSQLFTLFKNNAFTDIEWYVILYVTENV